MTSKKWFEMVFLPSIATKCNYTRTHITGKQSAICREHMYRIESGYPRRVHFALEWEGRTVTLFCHRNVSDEFGEIFFSQTDTERRKAEEDQRRKELERDIESARRMRTRHPGLYGCKRESARKMYSGIAGDPESEEYEKQFAEKLRIIWDL